MFMLVGELLEKEEEVVCKTWIRTRVWPLERSVSAAHLRACLLPLLSFSTATATNPFPLPPLLIANSFVIGSHIYLSIYLFFFSFPSTLLLLHLHSYSTFLAIQHSLANNKSLHAPNWETISRKPSPHFMDCRPQFSSSPPPIMGQQEKKRKIHNIIFLLQK